MFCSWTHCLISLSGVIRHNYFLHLLVLVLKLDNGIYHYLFSFFDLCSRDVSVIFLDVVTPLLPNYSSCMFFKTTKTTFSIFQHTRAVELFPVMHPIIYISNFPKYFSIILNTLKHILICPCVYFSKQSHKFLSILPAPCDAWVLSTISEGMRERQCGRVHLITAGPV